MLGEKILNWKLNWNRNFSKIKRKSKAYSEVRKIGVLIKNDTPKFNSGIEKMIQGFLSDGKVVEVVCYQTNIVNSKYNFPFFSFSKKELKWTGQIDNSHFLKLLETKYDYLISISDEMDGVLNYLLIASPAHLRIGNAGTHTSNQVDLLLHKDDDKNLSELAENIYNYLKKLK